jgi:hypothetical protein
VFSLGVWPVTAATAARIVSMLAFGEDAYAQRRVQAGQSWSRKFVKCHDEDDVEAGRVFYRRVKESLGVCRGLHIPLPGDIVHFGSAMWSNNPWNIDICCTM